MHEAIIPQEQVDDFIIVRAVSFTRKVQRIMTHDVLHGEDLPVLEWRLMFSIARFGSCHLAYISRKTSIDPAHGSRAAAALEKKGLITRRDDPKNKRRKLISLTPSGVVVFKRIWPRTRQKIQQITDQLERQEFEDLKRLLDLANNAAQLLLDEEIDPTTLQNSMEEGEQVAINA